MKSERRREGFRESEEKLESYSIDLAPPLIKGK